MQLVGIQIYNLDITRIKKQYKEMKYLSTNRVSSTAKEIKIETIKQTRHKNNNKYVTAILNKVKRTKKKKKEKK